MLKPSILLLLILVSYKSMCQSSKVYFNNNGISLVHLGENVAKISSAKPIEEYKADRNFYVNHQPFKFYFYEGAERCILEENYTITAILLAVDTSNVIISITILIKNASSDISNIIDNIFGEAAISANSAISNLPHQKYKFWMSNKENMKIFLSKPEDQSRETEIQLIVKGIPPQDCSIMIIK